MTRANHRGGFRARVAYAIRAIERDEDSRAFDSCFENYDGAAVVTAIVQQRPDLAPWGLSPHGEACWRETAEKHADDDLDRLSQRLRQQARADWERYRLPEIQGQGVLL